MKRLDTIKVDCLARVEGEGALLVKIKGGQVTDVKLQIFEPPRFFEAFLRGRNFSEAPDITARICGICPVAYQMSACHAMEDAFGVEDRRANSARCGACSIAASGSRATRSHIYMLHAPDFLGYADAIRHGQGSSPIVRQRGAAIEKDRQRDCQPARRTRNPSRSTCASAASTSVPRARPNLTPLPKS